MMGFCHGRNYSADDTDDKYTDHNYKEDCDDAGDDDNNNEGDCQKAESPNCCVTVIHSFISGRPAFLCIVNFLRHATVLCLHGFSSKTHEIKFGTEVSKWQSVRTNDDGQP